MADMRLYETYYGIHTDDWKVNFGEDITNHSYLLVKDYIDSACTCSEYTTVGSPLTFIYPHHLAKIYFIEGVIEGHIILEASSVTATIISYRVEVGKVNLNDPYTVLFTTGNVQINRTLYWYGAYGDVIGFPFWIDAWEKQELSEFDRICIRIYVTVADGLASTVNLYHGNGEGFEDLKITIPFMGI
jgi:hypothetical protein